MSKVLTFILVIALMLGLAGCDQFHSIKPGFYVGTNPDISFDLVKHKNSDGSQYFKIENLNLILPPMINRGVSYPSSYHPDLYYMVIDRDGAFSGGSGGDSFKGKIDDGVVSGHFAAVRYSVPFSVNGTFIKFIMIDNPVEYDLDWSAQISDMTPTSTPLPTPVPTAIPAKHGHYEGEGVSFDVTAAGVENFTSNLGVSKNYGCSVHNEPVLQINTYGLFSVTDVSNVSTFGVINGDTVIGGWGFTGTCAVYCAPGNICTYDPNVSDGDVWNAKWVRP